MRLAICVATMNGRANFLPGDIPSFTCHASINTPVHIRYNTPENNWGVVKSYQYLYQVSDQPVLAFVHDDVICRERGWDERVLKEFEDPSVGVVGFGGARQHGSSDIYRTPYRLQQLGRTGYLSNVDDAEVHGERFEGARDVAVIDGFAVVVRRELLDRCGGWGAVGAGCDFFCYDYAICALAHRLGYRVRVVGIRCHHRGGQTSVKFNGGSGITSPEAYESSHRWFYENFRDCLPWSCK